MSAFVHFPGSCVASVLAPLSVAALLFALPLDAQALSRRDQTAVDALNQRMQAAETKYREGVVKVGNADPEGQKQSDSALEDMEDVISACGKQRGCSVSTQLGAFKRLLKSNADAQGGSGTFDWKEVTSEFDVPVGVNLLGPQVLLNLHWAFPEDVLLEDVGEAGLGVDGEDQDAVPARGEPIRGGSREGGLPQAALAPEHQVAPLGMIEDGLTKGHDEGFLSPMVDLSVISHQVLVTSCLTED